MSAVPPRPDRPDHGGDPSGAPPDGPPGGPRDGPPGGPVDRSGEPRRTWWPWILGTALLVVAAGVVGVIASISSDVSRTVTVAYNVTGTARDVTITYVTWEKENRVVHSARASGLPWRMEAETTGFVRGRILEVMTGPGGGRATCSVVVDGGEPRTDTARGRYATAECSV